MMHALLALALTQDPALKDRVDAFVRDLGSDAPEAREAATEGLVKLGLDAEPLVRDALKAATDPEVQARLRAVLAWYVPAREEAFALELLKRGDPFPATPEKRLNLDNPLTVAQALDRIRDLYGLKVDVYADDEALRLRAKETRLRGSASSPTAAYHLVRLAVDLDALFVVDGDRVVLVRMTPRLLLQGVSMIDRRADEFEMQRTRDRITGTRRLSPTLEVVDDFLQGREAWTHVLSTAIFDKDLDAGLRLRALRQLGGLYGRDETPNKDVTAILLRVEGDLRDEALAELVYVQEADAVDAVRDAFEKGEPRTRRRLLLRFASVHWRGISALHAIREDVARVARGLEKDADADTALRASAMLAIVDGDDDAARRAIAAAWPHDADTAAMRVEVLRLRARKIEPEVHKALAALAADDDPERRLAAAIIYGNYAGGKDRAEDVEGALKLLDDPAPLVRAAAAYSLGVTYSRSAAELYDDGRDAALARLKAALEKEKDPVARKAIEGAIRD